MSENNYFDRTPFKWSILGFLDESDIEPFDVKVDCYIKSLEAIFDREKGARKERARVLLDGYREASYWLSHKISTGAQGDDRKIAKTWDKERKSGKTNAPSININHSTISGSAIGTIERGTFISEKRDQKETNLKHRRDDEGEITDKKTKLKSPRTEDDNFLDELKDDEDISYERRRRDSTPEDKIKTVNFDEVPSATTTTSLYVPTSPSTPSTPDSTISEEYIIVENRRYSMDYLTGPGVPEWHLNEDSIRWVVDGIDITEICHEYRAVVVKKCESMEVILSATEELILSHIFVFQEQSPLGLCEYFDDELWAELFVEFRRLYPYAPIPDKISNLFLNIVKIPCEEPNQTERQKLARRYLRNFEVITEEEEIIIEMFRELVDNEQSSFTRNYIVEDTHTIRNITPIILKPFFKNNKRITFEGANKMSESSAIAKRRFDPERLGTKPDFTVMTTNPQKHVELFIVEIKPNKTNNALVSEDLVSLGKTMKCAIDKSIKDGADDLVICGMQVIGFLGRAYAMDLRFEGIYRMILIGEFELPRGSTSWGTALQCYQVLNTIRVIVNKGATSYQTAIRMNKKSKSRMMIKPMFHSPTKVQKCKQY
ncbi:unnamed protein product [Rhizophagus irregularis]|uniref:Uncharacterized protein n=1 Tax=Rhizophagus irregularis TaxID=588596 RepID=A0A915Z1D0_9GLOM|nr:unnamed protein product [Rhizophagus irregularis]CAB5358683.1 unnamed protein product [Rhizophagus irregularis]